MKQIITLFLILFTAFSLQNTFGQTAQGTQEAERLMRQREKEQLRIRNKNNNYNNEGFIANRKMSPQPPDLYKGKPDEVRKLKKAYERTKEMLVVPKFYRGKYKHLLEDEKVNLARLQPDQNCYGEYVISADDLEKCSEFVPIPGNGSFYSFRIKKNYSYDINVIHLEDNITLENKNPSVGFDKQVDWWNIRFVNDKFIVQNSSVRGIISDIGDVDLTDISLTSKELDFLNNFKQKNTLAEIKEQSDALKETISYNNFTYSNSTRVKLNSTYVLRSIDYRSIRGTQLYPSYKFVDERADMTIVFKVVGRENDGSVIIIWKELKTGLLPD